MTADVLRLAWAAQRKKTELVMELVLTGLHQSGWLYFYFTIRRMLQKDCGFLASEELQPGDVADMHFKTSNQMFAGFHCGVKTRFSVGGIDFDAIYLKKPNTMETAIGSLCGFLSWADIAIEMMCCKKRDNRSEVADLFIKGQSLSTIMVDEEGRHNLWVKLHKWDWFRNSIESTGI
jgi:hypothetical protein